MRDLLKSINWRTFLIGVICGILISLSLIYFIGDRYVIVTGGPYQAFIFRLDKWTGKTWVCVGGGWKMVSEQEKEQPFVGWEEVSPEEIARRKPKK